MKNSNTVNENRISFGKTYVNSNLFYCIDDSEGLKLENDKSLSLKCEILDISKYENKEKAFEALEAKLRLLGLRVCTIRSEMEKLLKEILNERFNEMCDTGICCEKPKKIEMEDSFKKILNKTVAIAAFDENTDTITYYADEYIVGSQANYVFSAYCKDFMAHLDISNWTFNKNTTDINGIFHNLWEIKEIKLPNPAEPIYLMNVPTSKLENTFQNCFQLGELDLSCFRFVERGREHRSLTAFKQCEKLKKLNVSNFLPKGITYEELKEQKIENRLNSLNEITVDGKEYTF